jgi:hypothetical protein
MTAEEKKCEKELKKERRGGGPASTSADKTREMRILEVPIPAPSPLVCETHRFVGPFFFPSFSPLLTNPACLPACLSPPNHPRSHFPSVITTLSHFSSVITQAEDRWKWAKRRKDAVRREILFPPVGKATSEKGSFVGSTSICRGYKIRLSQNGLFVAMKNLWLEMLHLRFGMELSYKALPQKKGALFFHFLSIPFSIRYNHPLPISHPP